MNLDTFLYFIHKSFKIGKIKYQRYINIKVLDIYNDSLDCA